MKFSLFSLCLGLAMLIQFCEATPSQRMASQPTHLASARLQIPNDGGFKARFHQKRFLKALPTPIILEGNMTLWQNHGLIWETISPFPNTLLITKEGVFLMNNGKKKPMMKNGHTSDEKILTLFSHFLTGDLSSIEGFTFSPSSTAKNQEIIPLPPLSSFLTKIQLKMTDKGQPCQIILYRPNGDKDEINISHQKIYNKNEINQALSVEHRSLLR